CACLSRVSSSRSSSCVTCVFISWLLTNAMSPVKYSRLQRESCTVPTLTPIKHERQPGARRLKGRPGNPFETGLGPAITFRKAPTTWSLSGNLLDEQDYGLPCPESRSIT